MNTIKWFAFVRAMWPIVSALLEELFNRHDGDATAATAELRRIHDHWQTVRQREASIDARLEAVKKREGAS